MLRAFSVYYTAYGIQATIPSADPGDGLHPIGALALAATAVSQATFLPLFDTQCPIGRTRLPHALIRRLHFKLQQLLIQVAHNNRDVP